MEINFKPAENTDIETLLVLIRELYQVDGSVSFNAAVAGHALTQLLANQSFGYVWLIQNQGEAIGYVVLTLGYSLEYGGRDAFIDELYLRASHQRQGIGKKTIQFLEEVCISLGVRALHLEVERENISAQGFYRRVGFQDHDRRYLMTKWLTN